MTHPLGPLTVLDSRGREVRLETLWRDRHVVFLFVRHFGCIFCRQQVADMRPVLDQIRARGAELVIVGNGSAEEAGSFRDEQGLDCPVLTDPSRETYCAVGMRHGRKTVLRPTVWMRALAAFRKGFRQSAVAGDPYQEGGVIIVTRDGREAYRFVSESAGDHPNPAEVVAALDRVAATPAETGRQILAPASTT